MGLTAATALYELGSLADNLSCVEPVLLHHVVAEHDVEQRLVATCGADGADEVLGYGFAYLEHEVLGCCSLYGQHTLDYGDAADGLSMVHERLLGALYCLCLELLYFFLHGVMLLDILLDDCLQVFCVVEHLLQCTYGVLHEVNGLLAVLACDGLDTADACCHACFADNLEHADATSALSMDAAAELA